MSGSRAKRERYDAAKEARGHYVAPQKTPTRPYQSRRDATAQRAQERAADKAFEDSISPLIKNMRAMAGLPPARRPQ